MQAPRIAPASARRSRAFTLIELLVVIAIIAVLASMLLPALSRARAITKGTVCQTNLKQISMAFMFYVDDQNGYLPPVEASRHPLPYPTKEYGMWNALGIYTGFPQWGGLLEPPTTNDDPDHIKFGSYWGAYKVKFGLNKSIWACPDSTENESPWGTIYAESLFLQNGGGWNNTSWWPRALNHVQNPAEKIHVADSSDWHLGGNANVVRTGDPTTSDVNLYIHYQGTSMVFADGHAIHSSAKAVTTNLTNDYRLP